MALPGARACDRRLGCDDVDGIVARVECHWPRHPRLPQHAGAPHPDSGNPGRRRCRPASGRGRNERSANQIPAQSNPYSRCGRCIELDRLLPLGAPHGHLPPVERRRRPTPACQLQPDHAGHTPVLQGGRVVGERPLHRDDDSRSPRHPRPRAAPGILPARQTGDRRLDQGPARRRHVNGARTGTSHQDPRAVAERGASYVPRGRGQAFRGGENRLRPPGLLAVDPGRGRPYPGPDAAAPTNARLHCRWNERQQLVVRRPQSCRAGRSAPTPPFLPLFGPRERGHPECGPDARDRCDDFFRSPCAALREGAPG